MSYIYSQALGGGFLAGNCSDTDAFAPSSGSPTPKPCLWHDKTMEPSRLSRFGMMCKPLTDGHGAALLTWWLADSRARTSAWPEKAQGLTARAAACGTTWPASLARFDPATHSLKTAQLSLVEDLTGCCVTLPRSGTMQDGQLWELPTLARRTSASESGYWPTPCAQEASGGGSAKDALKALNGHKRPSGAHRTLHLRDAVKLWPTPCASAYKGRSQAALTRKSGRSRANDRIDHAVMADSNGQLNPTWVEWLMGWPLGQTELKPLETGKYQEWLQQHSICC